MQKKSLLGISPLGFHKISYLEWGSSLSERTILCVPGLTRNAKDFTTIAEQLCINARVISVDLPGRGESDWFSQPQHYNNVQYIADLVNLIARLDVKKITLLGTSLGGILGMYMAAQSNTPIEALILNDVGPFIPRAGLMRIGKYAGNTYKFSDLETAEKHFRKIYASCQQLNDSQWKQLTLESVIEQPDGTYILAYDPKVSKGTKFWTPSIYLWPIWEKISCPVLTLRGEKSDILLPETTDQMRNTGPRATVFEIPNCGHAPMLKTTAEIKIISDWLQSQSS